MPVYHDRILYEDEHLLAVAKRARELVVRGSGKLQKLPLLDYLKKEYPELQPLHRLDFETSGVVLFSKTPECQKAVVDSKHEGWVKTYHTLVMGRIHRQRGMIKKSLPARKGKAKIDAKTSYEVLDRFANSSFVEVEIETGRHHQIRRHFSLIGHPLALDTEYGHKKFNSIFTREFGYRDFFLHASSLSLPHPITGEQLTIEAPMPKTLRQILKILRSL